MSISQTRSTCTEPLTGATVGSSCPGCTEAAAERSPRARARVRGLNLPSRARGLSRVGGGGGLGASATTHRLGPREKRLVLT